MKQVPWASLVKRTQETVSLTLKQATQLAIHTGLSGIMMAMMRKMSPAHISSKMKRQTDPSLLLKEF